MRSIHRLSICLLALLLHVPCQAKVADNSSAHNAGAHGFDFYFGHWQVHNRRLLKPLQGSDEWESFDTTIDCTPILGGAANQDVFLSPHRPGIIGMSLTLFDPLSRRWSSYWLDSKSVVLQPPVSGNFDGNTAVLEGADEYAGKPILVRNIWSRTDTPSPRWVQAFSIDQGRTWETNWIMDLNRTAADAGVKRSN